MQKNPIKLTEWADYFVKVLRHQATYYQVEVVKSHQVNRVSRPLLVECHQMTHLQPVEALEYLLELASKINLVSLSSAAALFV